VTVKRTSPVRTMIAGAVAQVALFVALFLYSGLGPTAWLTGIAYLVIGSAAITTGLRRYEVTGFGPADLVTMTRAVLVGGVTALVANIPDPATVPVTLMVTIAAVALATDAVDGRVARRTGTVSEFGARFDMEVDAFLILVLSAYLADRLGLWVLAIGLMRYVFVVAGRLVRWMRAPLPHSMLRKTVAAGQGIVLVIAASGLLPDGVNTVIVVLALVTLAASFGYDVFWLFRHRADVEPESAPESGAELPARPMRRRVLAGLVTGLACVLMLFTLMAPNRLSHFTLATFARLPIEALILVGLMVLLPPVGRRIAAVVVGLMFGLLLIDKITDIGFNEVLARPFDLVLDWTFLGPGVDYLADSVGQFGAWLAVIGAGLLIVGSLVLMTVFALRLSRLLVARRNTATRTVAVLGVAWLVCAVIGVQFTAGTPVASREASNMVFDKAKAVHSALLDPQRFAKEAKVDPFRYTPGDQLLTGMRGKDFVLSVIESYGQCALEDPLIAPGVEAKLDAGYKKLTAAGFAARSGWLTSSTYGGGSWLAHASIQSGLWINNQQRYEQLTSGDRLSLTKAFKRAGWSTVGASPQIKFDWPEGEYFGYDKMYTWNNLQYKGPTFAYSKMPDQYLLKYFQDHHRAKPGHQPVMAELDLTSSHSPWAPVPSVINWNDVGDGKVFGPQEAKGPHSKDIWPDTTKVKKGYGQSIEYVLDTLISYLQTYGDKNLVMVFFGDHQPAKIVSGEDATHNVPITIVAKDPAVLDRITQWGWDEGLEPGANAPVWRMNKFRDRFLTAFGPGKSNRPVAAAQHR
jgi:phosphatidylglycerophosphate synthase